MNLIKRIFRNEPGPFIFVSKTPPHILYGLICNERNQTIAFIISFWKSKKYIKDFLNLLVINGRLATKDYIIEYLKNCPANYIAATAIEIERLLEKKIASFPEVGRFHRKKRVFKKFLFTIDKINKLCL